MVVPPSYNTPDIGTEIDDIETPAVLIDMDVMEANMAEYDSFAVAQDIGLRSHVKTHKTPDIAHRQLALKSANGILCQTLSEAEVMAQHGIDDIYLSYMVVEEAKLPRVAWLSDKLDYFATTVDGRDTCAPIERAARQDATEPIDVILELDMGLNRVGVEPGQPALDLAKYIDSSDAIRFQGIMAYEAHVTLEADVEDEYATRCWDVMDSVSETVESIEDAGIAVPEVKVGGTSTSKFSGRHPIVTEINPGMYPFNDVGELRRRDFELEKNDCAAMVLTTVISQPSDERVIVDAGSKSISFDIDNLSPVPRYRNDLTYRRASEEHGWIDVTGERVPAVGEKLEFIVPHVCTTINLHDTIIGIRNETVRETWEVAARGKVR